MDDIERLGKFELYDGPPDSGLPSGIMWFREVETGADWYAMQKDYEDDQSFWLGVQDDGRIRIVVPDLSMMVPIDLTVYGYVGDKTIEELQDHLFDFDTETIGAIDEPYDTTPVPQAVLAGVIALVIENDDIADMQMTSGLGFAMAIGPGVFWVFFSALQPDANYLVFPQASGFNTDLTAHEIDYFEVTVTNRQTGEPQSPASLSISVQRVQ